MSCGHLLVDENPQAAQALAEILTTVRFWWTVRELAARGGRPGNAAVVLTDVANVRAFFTEVPYALAKLVTTMPAGYPVTLGRHVVDLAPRVERACADCAAWLRAGVPGRLPVYVRLGAGEVSRGSAPFPAALVRRADFAALAAEMTASIQGGPDGR